MFTEKLFIIKIIFVLLYKIELNNDNKNYINRLGWL